MIENKLITDELWIMLGKDLRVSLPKYRINEYLAYLSKILMTDYKNEKNKVIAKVLLGLSGSCYGLPDYHDKYVFYVDDLMSLETRSFNALFMVILFNKTNKSTIENHFGKQFVDILKALYISP